MILDFLPNSVNYLLDIYKDKIYEIRIRANKPVYVNYCGTYVKAKYQNENIVIDYENLQNIVFQACNNSIYAYNDNIKSGFIALENGVRIGLSGKCVVENGVIKTIKNFTSVCIRIPNQIFNCGLAVYNATQLNKLSSVFVIAPSGVGKTTLLRDLIRLISIKQQKNILVIDENCELQGENFDLGDSVDVITNCDKNFGFYNAIKTMCPNMVVCDELISEKDVNGVMFASLSGAKILCSAHGQDIRDLKTKGIFNCLFNNKIFDFYVILKSEGRSFFVSKILNKEGNEIEF